MKKVMTVFLAAALVFAAAGQASAAALETSGEYRGRFWYLNNYEKIPADQGSNEFWDQRLRLNMNWKVSDTVKVGARADILENVWNTAPNAAQVSEQEIDFDWAYVAFNTNANTVFTVGKQDVSWGSGIYAKADNRYRFKFGTKLGELPVGFAYDKLNEDGDWSDDDSGYTVNTIVPVGGWKLGFLGIYRDKNDTLADGKRADSTFLALDVTANGVLGPATIAFEGAYGQGESRTIDTSGLMAYVGAFLPIGPVNVGLECGYARGNDPGSTDENEGLLTHDYNGAFNSFILFNNFDLNGWNSIYKNELVSDIGLNNALALKASGTFAFSKQLSLMGAAVWAQADEAVGDDDMGVEVDALLKYALNENVTLQTGVGYLWAGDYFVGDPDNPMVVTAHAVVAF